ncbi:unnamed protein product [Symbiodinium microadriaticum]|nr:unnamed protein product [Symbiodinium microadriaticum]
MVLRELQEHVAVGPMPQGHPNFDYKSQFFILTQNNGKLTIVKHFFLTKAKLTQAKLKPFAVGTCYEIVWGSGNKVLERKEFQWMLEQMGGLQFRQFSLTGERKRSASSAALGSCAEADQDASWDYIIEHGERDRGQLKQLRWIHKHINQDFHPTFLENIYKDAAPYLLDHSLWLLGEPGVGKTPLARVTAMMFSRYHGGGGQFRSAEDFDFFRGIFFGKATPALYDDEATFDKRDISNDLDFKHLMKNKNTSIMWEQWAGCIQRGHPQSLVLQRLTPKVTVKRAPGPGAIRRIEGKQIGTKLLKDRNVVLHTDSAKSYKLVIPGVIHDRVVHCRKRVKKNGKYTWMQAKYVSIVKHTLPNNKKIFSVKSGTQVIDRCWRFLKDRVQINQHSKAGSRLLRAKLRAAQYEYWYRNTDLWIKCGELCADHMKQFT